MRHKRSCEGLGNAAKNTFGKLWVVRLDLETGLATVLGRALVKALVTALE